MYIYLCVHVSMHMYGCFQYRYSINSDCTFSRSFGIQMDINKDTGDSFLLHSCYKVTEHLLFEKEKLELLITVTEMTKKLKPKATSVSCYHKLLRKGSFSLPLNA